MSKKTRDLIFIFFIIFFVLGTIFTSLYASGYKFNLSWPLKFNRLLIKTGMINLDTNPRGAIIYLNGETKNASPIISFKKTELTTPAKIRNVLPGEYNLVLKREGYQPFEKKISVHSGQTTFLEDVNLFRDELPLFIAAAPDGDLKISAERNYLYLPASGQIINLKTGRAIELENEIPTGPGEWLLEDEKLLNDGRLFDLEKNSVADYAALIGAEADKWYYDENNDRLYYRFKNSLAYLNLGQKTVMTIVSGEKYSSYEPRNNEIFFVALDAAGRTKIKKYSLTDGKIIQETELPGVADYRFIRNQQKSLTLYDEQNKTLYLINPDNLSDIKTIKNAASWAWIDDKNLFYNNSWEIHSFNLEKNSSSLVTRVGEEINQIIWNKNKDYLIFSSNGSLNALDLKNNIATTIFRTGKITSPVLDGKNNILYFWAHVGQQEGIYKLILQ